MARGDLYRTSGVDINKGEELVSWLNQQQGGESGKLGGLGGFAAFFRPDFSGMKDPVLVSGTDGVGTKVLLGIEAHSVRGLGVDLVAMCVNDLYCTGGRPLFFLDYFATGKLAEADFKEVLTGIRDGLDQSGAILVGGETAELPGMFAGHHFDIAGFVVGMVDFEKRLHPGLVQVSDVLVALESSGFHANGYSLLRQWASKDQNRDPELLERLLAPTKIYSELVPLIADPQTYGIHGLAHITGGGISGNLPRVMPLETSCEIEKNRLPTKDWMLSLIEQNNASFEDVEPVLNLGVGMIAVVSVSCVDQFMIEASEKGLKPHIVGKVVPGSGSGDVVYL